MPVQAIGTVFRRPTYLLLATGAAATVFAFAVWLPNLPLLVQVMGHAQIAVSDKLALPISLLGAIGTNFTPLSAVYTIAIAILFGMNIALGTYFVRHRISIARQSGVATGALGLMSGVLGVGCAACGSLLLTSLLSLIGATWILSYLPLAGGEFGILGVLLLLMSLCAMAKRVQDPAVCKSYQKN